MTTSQSDPDTAAAGAGARTTGATHGTSGEPAAVTRHRGSIVTDIAVIGAGPAGLAAAVAAADAGATVALIDSEPVVGGQFWRHPAKRGGTSPDGRSSEPGGVRDAEVAGLHHDLRRYRSLRRRLAGHVTAGIVIHLAGHDVWSVASLPGPMSGTRTGRDTAPASASGSAASGRGTGDAPPRFAVHAVTGAPAARCEVVARARSLVLATGVYDLQVPFPGWDLPGVMTAGGVQSLLKGHAVLAGRRVVVAGTGPFLLSVASGLLRSGATVPGVFEAARPARWLREVRAAGAAAGKLAEGAGYARDLARHRVRYRTGWTVLRADGDRHVTSVTVAPVDPAGIAVTARARRIDADVLAVGWGFVPQLEIPLALGCGTTVDRHGLPVLVVDSDQRTSVPGVYAAGEICGVGGAALAVVEGEIAGGSAAEELSDPGGAHRLAVRAPAPRHGRLARRRASLRAFAEALARVYPVPTGWVDRLDGGTVVCRCEEVTVDAIREVARRDGGADARSAKLLARPGMGWCQGRICGYATECLAAQAAGLAPRHGPAERPVVAPIPLGVVGEVSKV